MSECLLLINHQCIINIVSCKENEICHMLSKSRIKLIRSLRLIKFRAEEKLFIIEGDKLVREALSPTSNSLFKLHSIYGIESWMEKNQDIISSFKETCYSINNKELGQISNLKTPNQVIAIVHRIYPDVKTLSINKNLLIGLDNVQDPGNMGTIIRLADWFGIDNILLSPGCADPFNPKVVQASMGSIFRVRMHELDLIDWLSNLPKGYPVYGAVLRGADIYRKKLEKKGIIIFGNESQGICEDVEDLISDSITIPRVGLSENGPESLNVSVALGIILSEFYRQNS